VVDDVRDAGDVPRADDRGRGGPWLSDEGQMGMPSLMEGTDEPGPDLGEGRFAGGGLSRGG